MRERCEARCPQHGKRCSGPPSHGPLNHTHPFFAGAQPRDGDTCVWSTRRAKGGEP